MSKPFNGIILLLHAALLLLSNYSENQDITSGRPAASATFLSTQTAGGFVGCVYALYATSLGETSYNAAWYDWFEYIGNDQQYR